MKEINSIHLTRLNLGAHYEFHRLALQLMLEAGPEELHIEGLVPFYQIEIEREGRGIIGRPGLPNTRKIKEADAMRDFYLRNLLKTAKTFCRSPVDEERLEAEIFWSAISNFDGAPYYEMTKETALVERILSVMEEEGRKNFIEKIGLGYTVGKLKEYNDLFIGEMDKRIEELGRRERIDEREQKRIVNAYYLQMVRLVNAYALTAPTPAIEQFIKRMNGLIRQFKHVLSRY